MYTDFEHYSPKRSKFIDFTEFHRIRFRLAFNLHDLYCRGAKNSVTALANVENFVAVKILGKQSSIPHKSNDVKRSVVDVQILYNLQMDIENYNYYSILLQEYFRKTYLRGHIPILPQINPAHSYIPVELSPPGMTLHRNPIKFVNNWYVELVAKSYTSYEQDVKDN